MNDFTKRSLKEGKSHLNDQKGHNKSRNILDPSMPKWMITVRRFSRHTNADKTNNGGSCIG